VLKALLTIQSATSVGVSYSKHGDLLVELVSTVELEKTKVKPLGSFWMAVDDTIRVYKHANDTWSDYFKYDFEREKGVLMSGWDIKEFRERGVRVDTSRFQADETDSNTFYVPINSALSLYWEEADSYIQNAKTNADFLY
jgi:hypothetical protein